MSRPGVRISSAPPEYTNINNNLSDHRQAVFVSLVAFMPDMRLKLYSNFYRKDTLYTFMYTRELMVLPSDASCQGTIKLRSLLDYFQDTAELAVNDIEGSATELAAKGMHGFSLNTK